jgi:hypothetical protein
VNWNRDFKNWRFWRALANHALAALGFIAVALGVYDVFVPNTLAEIRLPSMLLLGSLALIYAIWRSWPRPIEQHYSSPDTRVRLVTGDLFEQDRNLVIGMSDTFDVETPHVIATSSVQGQLLAKVYHHDVANLRADIASALSGTAPVGYLEKKGNREKYPVGTVATIRHQRKLYFCVAYTEMDWNCNVSSSIGHLWESLMSLWDEVRRKSNGDPVAIPVIGLGQSGLSTTLPMQDSIRFIILSFMFASREARVCDGLDVVVRPQDVGRVDMLEVRDFLRSLRAL